MGTYRDLDSAFDKLRRQAEELIRQGANFDVAPSLKHHAQRSLR
jgi:hypothetical protein